MRSKDATAALLTFQITGDPATAKDRVGPALAATAAVQRAHSEIFIGQFGDGSANQAVNERIQKDFQRAEITSLPVTLLILLLAFGAVVAAGIPLLPGMTAVAGALGVTALVSHLMPVDPQIDSVILLIGLAVGIDYSLFYLRRAREERGAGADERRALQPAAATSGRAVLFSGFVVMTAMAGMFLLGSRTFASVAVGTVLVVAIALLGSLTVLPAVPSKLGDRVERGRIPLLARYRGRDGESRVWRAVISLVMRHPLILGGAAAAALIALAIPALTPHRQLGHAGAPARPARDAGLCPHPAGVSRRRRPRGGGRERARRDPAAGHRGRRGAQARRTRQWAHARTDHRRGQHLTPSRPRDDPPWTERAPTRPPTARSTRCAAR